MMYKLASSNYVNVIQFIRLLSFDLKFGADTSVDSVQLESNVKAFRGVATPDMAAVQQEVSLLVFHKEAAGDFLTESLVVAMS